MKKAILGISVSMAAVLLASACAPQSSADNAPDVSEEVIQETLEPDSKLCFVDETVMEEPLPSGLQLPEGATEAKDVMELIVLVDGSTATGEYNWIPMFKDQRFGSFTGTFEDNTINATYDYMQEGQEGTANIVILLDEDQATVEGGDPALGLDQTLPRVNCQ